MVSEDVAEAIVLWEDSMKKYSDALDKFSSIVEESFGLGNLNESNKTDFSREKLSFRNKVTWYDSEDGKDYITGLFESIPWEDMCKKYELNRNPKQQNLLNLIDILITDKYEVTISDPHFVLSLPTELQSYRKLWFLANDQELYIYAKKAEEEVLIKKEVSFCGPVPFWYTGIHYLVEIQKNEKARDFDHEAVLNVIEYGEPKPGLVQKLKQKKDSDRETFEKMFRTVKC